MNNLKKPRGAWALRLGAALLVLVAVSTWRVTGLSARMTSGSQSSDGARVAAFAVNTAGTFAQDLEADLAPGETDSGWELQVMNQCETAIAYTVEVENVTGNLPLGFTLDGTAMTGTDGTLTATVQRQAEKSTEKLKLVPTWAEGDGNLQYMGMIDQITVKLSVVQVD